MKDLQLYDNIKRKIITLRGTETILDRDLSVMYGVETRALKQAVKRNITRFPDDFMFELRTDEIDFLVSQSVIPSKSYFGGSKPYAFTEQGVAMLSSVLNSQTAIQVSIQIMKAFVFVRSILNVNYNFFKQLSNLEQRHTDLEISTNIRFDEVFKAISSKKNLADQGIFYDGQIFDAYKFVSDIVKSANSTIDLIDNYIDESVLTLLSKRNITVKATIYTNKISKQLTLDLERFNAQYPKIEVKVFSKSHDRFLIIDNKTVYHIGASLKDLGRKWFAFAKINLDVAEMITKLERQK